MQRVSLLVREMEAGWSRTHGKGKTRDCIDAKITNHAHNKRRKKIRTSHCDCLLYISIPGRGIGIWTESGNLSTCKANRQSSCVVRTFIGVWPFSVGAPKERRQVERT